MSIPSQVSMFTYYHINWKTRERRAEGFCATLILQGREVTTIGNDFNLSIYSSMEREGLSDKKFNFATDADTDLYNLNK